MKNIRQFILVIMSAVVLLSACGAPTGAPTSVETTPTLSEQAPTPAPASEVEPIYLAIIWHQHQPVYFKDPETGIYVRPWVRVHASKDYVDMAAILKQYPKIHATFNLTPSLIRQLDDLAGGAKDLYWVYAEIPASELSIEQKQFILERFFDTNRKIIDRFPRYKELLQKRASADEQISEFSDQDFLDLQVLFNLAWTDPDWLEQEPLASLMAKGKDFCEEDKAILFAEHLKLIREVIPIHRELQDAGQIEVTMTPFAHPILPLLVTTDLARKALPDLELPDTKFVYGQDAVAQVALGVQLYEDHFGCPPRGMWPAEGSVAQEIVSMVAQNDLRWMASDEGVLANSLGFTSFIRNANETVIDADMLYRPYYVEGKRGGPVATVFRDIVLSDKVGFTYSGLKGRIAAADFIQRIHAAREELIADGAKGPHLVSVILDGENAWEYYENDGKEFLHSLYQRLSEDPLIITVTPSEFLDIAPDQPRLDHLWAGSWINHDFSTWIGEDEENTAWEYLADTREFLQKYITGPRKGRISEETLDEAKTLMYIAEGSDWFWWYGADQNSGNDESFDQQFRDTLKTIYLTLREEPPKYLDVPIIPQQAVSADRPSTGLIEPIIDGVTSEGEWDAAGLYQASGGVMAKAQPFFDSLTYGFDSKNLYLRLALAEELSFPSGDSYVGIYLDVPGSGASNSFSHNGSILGFPANRLLEIQFTNGSLAEAVFYVATANEEWITNSSFKIGGPGLLELSINDPTAELTMPLAYNEGQLELAIPLSALGNADTGDRLTMRALYSETLESEGGSVVVDVDQMPEAGPVLVAVPDLGTTTILVDIVDPSNDDHGPGNYSYPTDAVFNSGNFDLLNFQMGYDVENIVFKFTMRGPVDNSWGSPNGLSVQTFDVYIDLDGDGEGGIAMLPGRNLSLQEGNAWDLAITAEGWTPGIYTPGEGGPQQIAEPSEFIIMADPGQRKVAIRVPRSFFSTDPEDWRLAAVVLSQEGFPSSGVMRVRDVLPVAEQWRIGGAPLNVSNHTRVMDLVWPVEGEQEAWMSDFINSDLAQAELTADDFAKVPMFAVGE